MSNAAAVPTAVHEARLNDIGGAQQYVYVTAGLQTAGLLRGISLADTTERHPAELCAPSGEVAPDPAEAMRTRNVGGAVFEMIGGLPSEEQYRLIGATLKAGRRAWLWWPSEQAIECVDAERIRSLRRHVLAYRWMTRVGKPLDEAITRWHRLPTGLRWIYRGEFPVRRLDIFVKLNMLALRAQPIPVDHRSWNTARRLAGAGVYLRTDFWTGLEGTGEPPDSDRFGDIITGLSSLCEHIVCLTPWRDRRLDDIRAQQVVMDLPRQSTGEDAIVLAPAHYWPIVKASCQALRPLFLYERLCAGESVGAELSQLLRIPYIVEYSGSEALIREAIGADPAFYPELYEKAEELALRQATAIVVPSAEVRTGLVSRGINASRVIIATAAQGLAERLADFMKADADVPPATSIQTGDAYKDRVQDQWNTNPVGSHHARESQPHTLEWFLEVERHRYGVYAPWMPETMEFARHGRQEVLEIGGGMGTDLAQFAAHGAAVTDLDLSAGHLQLAEENFRLRGLTGRFVHHDAETLPFEDNSFDLVYSNGVLHHTPNTAAVVREIRRVLRPGGRVIVMVYAENSLHYWRNLFWTIGVKDGALSRMSMGEIMSRSVERSANDAKPLVKVYTKDRLRALFGDFARLEIIQRQLIPEELPRLLKWSAPLAQRFLGWNLIVKGVKP